MSELDLEELAAELSEFAPKVKPVGRSTREERIIAGFEDIQRFFEAHGRLPQHGEDRDIFERLYAVRLERIRSLPECMNLLLGLDRQGLLATTTARETTLTDDELLAELDGIEADKDIRVLRHVTSREERRAAEEIASRTPCLDFEQFQPHFAKVQDDLANGRLETRRFTTDGAIGLGDFFILGGQFAYVAEKGPEVISANGQTNARLRVIYSNATESNLLLRSLQRALEKDDTGRRVLDTKHENLFSGKWDEEDIANGTIYVLRSKSMHSYIAEHRDLIHKIGVTGGSIESRISQASREATYLFADVEIVATYKLAAVNRQKLEALFHRVFAPAQLKVTIHNEYGSPVQPQEWFLVPLQVIDEAVQRITDGSITRVIYDPAKASLIEVGGVEY